MGNMHMRALTYPAPAPCFTEFMFHVKHEIRAPSRMLSRFIWRIACPFVLSRL